jgi:uncharacterized membrane protein YbhN (UPF0104 family)
LNLKHFKSYFRWVILTFTLVFIAHTLYRHWREVLTLEVDAQAGAVLAIALGVTLLAHIWSGWVWGWIIQLFGQPTDPVWIIATFLKTNLAKYLPGNIWHFVGRVRAIQNQGASTGIAVMGVVLEPVLMAAAALILSTLSQPTQLMLPLAALVGVLVGIHPRILNPVTRSLSRSKFTAIGSASDNLTAPDAAPDTEVRGTESVQAAVPKNETVQETGAIVKAAPATDATLKTYPLLPLFGEIIFVLGRGLGFILVVYALMPAVNFPAFQVVGQFSIAWLMGLIIPGAPGGLGVFEVTALTLMSPTIPTAVVIGSVAIYRLISTLAEVLGAVMVGLDGLWNRRVDSA